MKAAVDPSPRNRASRPVLVMLCAAMFAAAWAPAHAEAAKKSTSIDNAQWFAIVSRADGSQSIEVHSFECQRREGLQLDYFPYESRANQQWRFVSQSNGTYAIVVRHTRQAMTVVTTANRHVELRAMRRSNAANQQWIVKRVRSYYVIHPAGAPHRSVSIPAGKLDMHALPLEITDGSAATWQQWLLEPSYTIADAPPLPCRPLPDRPLPDHLLPDWWHPAPASTREK